MSFSWDELDHMRPDKEWRLPLPPTCRKCGYNLSHLPEERCPECGTPFTWPEVHRRTARLWTLSNQLRHANQDAVTGIICSLAGWFSIGFLWLAGGAWFCAAPVIAGSLAVMAVILGAQVLNLRHVPSWARAYIGEPPPSILLGATAMFLGLTLLAGVLVLW